MKAYISCSMKEPMERVSEVSKILSDYGYLPRFWVRGTGYKEDALLEAEVFVLIIKEDDYKISTGDVTVGCLKELGIAYREEKVIYLAYKTHDTVAIVKMDKTAYSEFSQIKEMNGGFIPRLTNVIINNYEIY